MNVDLVMFWFGVIVAGVYGLVVGSFLNVCIYRLPPRVYYFDDLFFRFKTGDLLSDVKMWWHGIFSASKGKDDKIEMEPYLYAEALWMLQIYPEMAAITSAVHAFNLYKAFFPERVTIVKPRSFCPACRRMIVWWMNVPLLSYFLLGGKCFYCKAKISLRYPLIELISGLLCAGLFYAYGAQSFITFLFYYTFSAICILIFFIDLDHWIIMDEITLPFTAVAFIWSLFIPVSYFVPRDDFLMQLIWDSSRTEGIAGFLNRLSHGAPSWLHPASLLQSVSGAVLCYLVFWAVAVVGTYFAKREAMGGGDLKFAMLMGAFLGPQKAMIAFFIAVLVGTLILLPLLISGKKTGKDQVPFGCFLSFAAVVTIFLGDSLIYWFLNWPVLFS